MNAKFLLPTYPKLVWYFAGVNFLTRFITFMMLPLTIIYLSNIGYEETEVGSVLGIGWILGAFGGPIVGYLVDKLGTKKVYALILLLWSISYIGFGFSQQFTILMALSLLNGFCRSTIEVVILSGMFASVPKEMQANINKFQYLLLNWGTIMGTAFGAFMGKYVEQSWFIYIGIFFIFLLLLDRIIPLQNSKVEKQDHLPIPQVAKIISRDKILLLLLFSGICYMTGYIQLDSSIPIALNNEDRMSIYAFLNLENSILVVLLAVPVMKLTERWRPSIVIFIMTFFVSASLLCFMFDSALLYYIGVFFYTLGEIAFVPLWRQKIAELGGSMQATYLGLTNISYLGFFFGSFLGGMFYEIGGSTLVFPVMAVIVQFTFVFYIFAIQLKNKQPKKIVSEEKIV